MIHCESPGHWGEPRRICRSPSRLKLPGRTGPYVRREPDLFDSAGGNGFSRLERARSWAPRPREVVCWGYPAGREISWARPPASHSCAWQRSTRCIPIARRTGYGNSPLIRPPRGSRPGPRGCSAPPGMGPPSPPALRASLGFLEPRVSPSVFVRAISLTGVPLGCAEYGRLWVGARLFIPGMPGTVDRAFCRGPLRVFWWSIPAQERAGSSLSVPREGPHGAYGDVNLTVSSPRTPSGSRTESRNVTSSE